MLCRLRSARLTTTGRKSGQPRRTAVGGRSATYERELQRARDIAMQELQDRAQDAGANAVVGVDLDYEVLGKENGMLMVSASGTAVVVE